MNQKCESNLKRYRMRKWLYFLVVNLFWISITVIFAVLAGILISAQFIR